MARFCIQLRCPLAFFPKSCKNVSQHIYEKRKYMWSGQTKLINKCQGLTKSQTIHNENRKYQLPHNKRTHTAGIENNTNECDLKKINMQLSKLQTNERKTCLQSCLTCMWTSMLCFFNTLTGDSKTCDTWQRFQFPTQLLLLECDGEL